MGAMEQMTVTLPADMAATLREQASEGDYASASEIIREAVRDWLRLQDEQQHDLISLRDALQIGMDSGAGQPADEVFHELRARYAVD